MSRVWPAFLLLAQVVLGSAVLAQDDLDVERARRRYEEQRQLADRTKRVAEDRSRELDRARTQVSSAERQVRDAEQEIDRVERQLRDLEIKIRDLEREISNLEWEIPREEQDLRTKEDDRRRAVQERDRLQRQAEQLQAQIQRLEDEIARLRRQDPPPEDRIRELERERNTRRNELSNVNSDLSRKNRDIQNLDRQIADLDNSIQNKRRRLSTARSDHSQHLRTRDRLLFDLEDARANLRNAQNWLMDARRLASDAERDYRNAEADWQREERLAEERWAYYQQVLANYNRERDRIFEVARSTGSTHGSQEASARFPNVGTDEGLRDGAADGEKKGLADGRQRDYAQGYRDGRASAASDPALAASYRDGYARGEALAVTKAEKEDYPRGYNDAYSETVASVPMEELTLDVTTTMPDDAGGSGLDLTNARKTPGRQDPPSFANPSFPVVTPPDPGRPAVSAPSRDNRFDDPPCSNLRLPEFAGECLRLYRESYASGFSSRYQQIYSANYASAYRDEARRTYDRAYANSHSDRRTVGLSDGAKDQGILDGFARRLPSARDEQYTRGRSDFARDRQQGYLLIVRGTSFTDSNGDGITQRGEAARLTVVIDNLGLDASPKDKLRLVVTGHQKLRDLTFEMRDLPALPANTRVTLVGVVSGTLATEFAQETYSISGRIERTAGARYEPIHAFETSGTTRFPLEISTIEWPGRIAIGAETTATFVYSNPSKVVQPTQTVKLMTSEEVSFVGGGEIEVPELAPGENTTIDVKVKPTYWVGETTPVRFYSTTGGDERPASTQVFAKQIAVVRDAAVALFDGSGRRVAEPRFRVKAGGTLPIQVNLDFLANAYRPGPFVLEHWGVSDSRITRGNGSAVRINYGSWGPGSRAGNSSMIFQFPRELAGTTQWIALRMLSGSTTIHGVRIWVDVE